MAASRWQALSEVAPSLLGDPGADLWVAAADLFLPLVCWICQRHHNCQRRWVEIGMSLVKGQGSGRDASRHSSECEALHGRLAGLDAEESSLRSTLTSLQRELEEANEQRRAKDAMKATVEFISEGGSADGQAGDGNPPGESPDRLGALPLTPGPTSPASFAAWREQAGSIGG
eukprot:CAMPEP_0177535920 /NCGR_PEP_ID=MMETSP0369-20130122/56856_1 /TAXON_ID=447022 ORGANISM="Scrippsiella hangoei-like, Strain SHHI-4" /NCGR_SAMPLE_ID=MMETSP0369 /ASSEMBLY_ACC=CAM_ASM_000364 /LENGTH=172 /DNA_ID=CAMNT_0019018207 /DNA_START=46 /DNA_END=561 /DNA_ORIENTATION=-